MARPGGLPYAAPRDRSAAVDQDCIKLASYFSGHGFTGDSVAGLRGSGGIAASIVLRGTDGAGHGHHFRAGRSLDLPENHPGIAVAVGSGPGIGTVLDQALTMSGSALVTLERARLLSEEIDPVGLWDRAGEATRMTVYFSRQDRIYQVPVFEVICELLHRRGMDGATVLAGIGSTFRGRRQRPHPAGRGDGPPMMVIAVGSGEGLGLVLPEIGNLLRHPLITLEHVRVCKHDGRLITPPRAVPGTDADGRPLWHKLTVYACGSPRHDGEPVHRAISRRLHAAGLHGVITLRGLWGFRGDRAPHGGRHAPGVTIVIGPPERMPAAFSVIDELTAGRGLVTSETVAAVRAGARHES
jgi:PII-like signaling protein